MWLGINVEHTSKNLISIPIGLSNDHPKNVNFDDLIEPTKEEEDRFMYVNFNESTNHKHRSGLYELFSNFDWATVEKSNLNKSMYVKHLSEHKFALCPWGNGIDTHRFWESIYLGTIPVTKKSITYNSAKGLPHVLVSSYKNLNPESLNQAYDSFISDLNYQKLKVGFWINLISKKIDSEEKAIINSSGIYINYLKVKYRIQYYLQSKLKIVLYYLKKLKNKVLTSSGGGVHKN